jgi:hypothetical protein
MSKTLPLVFGASTHNQLNQKKETKQIYRVQINMLCVSVVSGEGFIFFFLNFKGAPAANVLPLKNQT